MYSRTAVLLTALALSLLAARATDALALSRHYVESEPVGYHMKASNQDRERTITYEADAVGSVVRDPDGNLVEELRWENFVSNGKPTTLPPQSIGFRQRLNLDPSRPPGLPTLAPRLVGPILDLLTFYSDLWLVYKQRLKVPGDHATFAHGLPNSWAGGDVTLGQDSIDFDLTFVKSDAAAKTATFLVRHVPPPRPQIVVPVDWMTAPAGVGPNNWIQVERKGDKYIASVGRETFDCEIIIDPATGKILSTKMDNPIDVIERECVDENLTQAGEPIRYRIFRHIELMQKMP